MDCLLICRSPVSLPLFYLSDVCSADFGDGMLGVIMTLSCLLMLTFSWSYAPAEQGRRAIVSHAQVRNFYPWNLIMALVLRFNFFATSPQMLTRRAHRSRSILTQSAGRPPVDAEDIVAYANHISFSTNAGLLRVCLAVITLVAILTPPLSL